MKLPLSLIKGLSDDKKKVVEAQYINSQTLLKQLRAVVVDKMEAEYAKEELSSDLESVFKSLGYRRGLREILNILPSGSVPTEHNIENDND